MAVHPELTPNQKQWFKSAVALIDVERMRRLNAEITAIQSPTGRERAASEYMAQWLGSVGIDSWIQPMGELSANAVGRIRGSGGGPSLLLYAPIDTHLEGNEEDLPWAFHGGGRPVVAVFSRQCIDPRGIHDLPDHLIVL